MGLSLAARSSGENGMRRCVAAHAAGALAAWAPRAARAREGVMAHLSAARWRLTDGKALLVVVRGPEGARRTRTRGHGRTRKVRPRQGGGVQQRWGSSGGHRRVRRGPAGWHHTTGKDQEREGERGGVPADRRMAPNRQRPKTGERGRRGAAMLRSRPNRGGGRGLIGGP
jgi:hypothetical protein